MNWFTKQSMTNASSKAKQDAVAEWGGCEHVEADANLVVRISYENDSFGREGYCMCLACVEQSQKEEDEELVFCHDCKTQKPSIEVRRWRWYDFYAAQGDEPICVCKECQTKEKHIERVRQDREECEWELNH